jgi:CRISPR-associated protein Csb1
MIGTDTFSPTALLSDATRHRITLKASLMPVAGDRFQPAGFPEIGHVIYRAPRPDRSTEDVCIVDSAASMANHLETVCLAGPFSLDLHENLAGLPYLACLTDGTDGNGHKKPDRLVVTSLSEGHRLASSYFLSEKAVIIANGKPTAETFISKLNAEFGLQNLGTKTHPLPDDWWKVFTTIFRYDPNSLVHGILFPSLGIKIPRVLTAHLEAFGASRVGSSGVKFDKLGKTTSGQPIFAVDEETASEIRATFIVDLSLIRSFGRGDDQGLNPAQKGFLLAFALWKIRELLAAPFRFRSNCDLQLQLITWVNGDLSEPGKPKDKVLDVSDLSIDIAEAIAAAGFTTNGKQREIVTKVYWPSEDLFKPGRDSEETVTGDGEETETAEEEES